jgi:hypothetical protein
MQEYCDGVSRAPLSIYFMQLLRTQHSEIAYKFWRWFSEESSRRSLWTAVIELQVVGGMTAHAVKTKWQRTVSQSWVL